MVGELWTQVPPILGLRIGAAFFRLTGSENVSEIVVFEATACAPAAGTEDFR